ncbi:TetR family transcriptional regulator [Actinoplanes philippinensis]|uniref:DNA-binding transcriptional regulator, AcrR family n=1 Tax=Actinoplanes philippinensis TaxID=35752 RepID=A0A1I2NBN1_9ACTN|nr:TetR/AcrR family transcriptional regulator [Actinoplanes philippinensis]GIE83483.1 TetR family transcriptional regulator [Actinoplanes philippinensis]SFG01152.1 DNA-binding transcriptional regulator, AcrR family [Actinoplanes philippinensis]
MTRATTGRPLRADARRNYDRILAAAETVFAEQGADGSLEEIARRAEVGSATLHRHFPSRRALLLAVFEDGIAALCARARALIDADADPGAALTTWLRALAAYTATHRGLSLSLLPSGPATGADDRCHVMLGDAGRPLLDRAQRAGAVRPDVALADLLTLVTAIALATEATGDPAEAERLLTLALTGIGVRPAASPSPR